MTNNLIRANAYNSILQKWINDNKYIVKPNTFDNNNNTNNKNSKKNEKDENNKYNNYVDQKTNNKDNASHNLLNGGQYVIPDDKLQDFYKKYSEDVSKDLQNCGNFISNYESYAQHSLSENGYYTGFPIFIDLDLVFLRFPGRFDQDSISLIGQIIQQSTRLFYEKNSDEWWFTNGLMIITQNNPTAIDLEKKEEEFPTVPQVIGVNAVKNHNNKLIFLNTWDNRYPTPPPELKKNQKLGVHIHFPNLIVNTDQISLLYRSWICDLDKYITYNSYFSNSSLLKLYWDPNDPTYSLNQWMNFIDSAVYNSSKPHLRMVFSHKISQCKDCIGQDKNKKCSTCKNTKKVDAGYNSLHFPVYILNGDGSPTQDHLNNLKKSHKILYNYEKMTFFDGKQIKVSNPMRTDIRNKFQGQSRVDYINKMVNYCRVRVPKEQKLTENFIDVSENLQYVNLKNSPKNYFLTSNDLVTENNKKKRKTNNNNNNQENLQEIVEELIYSSSNKKRKTIEKKINSAQNIDISNWSLYNAPNMIRVLNEDINKHHKEWQDIKITTVRKPNSGDELFIINVDNKYAKYCENVNRFHTCSNIYFILNIKGLSQRCFSNNGTCNPEIKCSNFRGKYFSYQTKYLAMFKTRETNLLNVINNNTYDSLNQDLLKDFNNQYKHDNNNENSNDGTINNLEKIVNRPYKTLLESIKLIIKK